MSGAGDTVIASFTLAIAAGASPMEAAIFSNHAAGVVVGTGVHYLPEALQLTLGIPAILAAFGAVLWTKGFGPEDRELFRLKKADVAGLREAEEAAQARDAISDDIV